MHLWWRDLVWVWLLLGILNLVPHVGAEYLGGKLLVDQSLVVGLFGLGKSIVGIGGTIFFVFIVYRLRKRLLFFITGEFNVNCAWQDIFTCCGCCMWGAVGKTLGVSPYRIKITTLEIDWADDKRAEMGAMDLYIKITCGSDPAICTRVHNGSNRDLEVFTDTIHCNVRTTDGYFVLVLMEQDALYHDQLARFQFDSSDVVSWAKQEVVQRNVPSQMAIARKKGHKGSSWGGFLTDESSAEHALAAKLNIGFKMVKNDEHDQSDEDYC